MTESMADIPMSVHKAKETLEKALQGRSHFTDVWSSAFNMLVVNDHESFKFGISMMQHAVKEGQRVRGLGKMVPEETNANRVIQFIYDHEEQIISMLQDLKGSDLYDERSMYQAIGPKIVSMVTGNPAVVVTKLRRRKKMLITLITTIFCNRVITIKHALRMNRTGLLVS